MDDEQSTVHESDPMYTASIGSRHGDTPGETMPGHAVRPIGPLQRDIQSSRRQEAAYGRIESGPWHADELTAASSIAESIVATIPEAILVLDADLCVRSANPAFYALFQVVPAETEGHALYALGNGQWDVPWLRESLGQLLSQDRCIQDADIEMDAPHIGHRAMQVHARRLVGSAPPGLILLAVEDITARKAIEQQRQAFVLLLAHELRNPLTSIMGYVQIMQRRAIRGDSALAVIMAAAKQLNRLVDDLLDGSSRGFDQLRLKPQRMDLTALARASVRQAQVVNPNHTVRLELPSGPLYGCWDEVRLAQVFANLIGNATKYSPNDGEIVVWVDDLGTMARVSIRDTGVGILPAELPHLFGEFYRVAATTRQADGLGLGLHVVKMLVEAHGGTVGVESAPGLGSTFYFTLPLAVPVVAAIS